MLSMRLLGVRELTAEMVAIQARVDLAIMAATKKSQTVVVRNVKKNMNGRPRWNHRGRSRIYPADINVLGMPRNVPRGGGPGILTGMLRAGVGGKKKLVNSAGMVRGGVGVGGQRLRSNNVKKRKIEAKYPFFEPGVQASEAEMAAIFTAAMTKAIR